MIYMSGEPQWNDIDRIKAKNMEKSLFLFHFVPHRSHMD
jgi:hypothetical protein